MGTTRQTERPAAGGPKNFTVTSDQSDRRLDRVLRGLHPEVPLSAIMKSIRKGAVRVNGAKKDCAARLETGDVVLTPWGGTVTEKSASQAISSLKNDDKKLRTLLKTESVWCVDKPSGLLSQPDRSGGDSVVTRAWAQLNWSRDDFRPALLGRLDRNVSGAVMIALDAPTLRFLSCLMREGSITKIYRALVLGCPVALGEINLPLQKDERTNRVFVDDGGQSALTRYRVLEGDEKFSLVELELVTGRPHQARVHMSSIGHPIAGDFKYGDENQDRAKKGIFLHAYSLTFPDNPELPDDLSSVSVISPLPAKFTKFLH
jgi:23S rRNA pseudouridine955/2504/2580 synthase